MAFNVGGLPYLITEGQLADIFSAHGTVRSARLIPNRFISILRG
ncbi:MAG: hypothetical protein IH857_03645 [Deltaproteobacteria bacterium]|nr:hypothetical protein [Deltaproteobacteria bacterium]